jgi:hypothetical protein
MAKAAVSLNPEYRFNPYRQMRRSILLKPGVPSARSCQSALDQPGAKTSVLDVIY